MMAAIDRNTMRYRVGMIASALRDGHGLQPPHVNLALSRLDALADDLGKGLLDIDQQDAEAGAPDASPEAAPETQPESLGQMIKREGAAHQGGAA